VGALIEDLALIPHVCAPAELASRIWYLPL
jgi:hypothetical protein